mmetsp:Transcript_16529/g.51714  ORF Transcript_16529/g.51714 Transcript_16529/m.51714 type:complete len:420 (-) Transcript_16529:133-1392(-)
MYPGIIYSGQCHEYATAQGSWTSTNCQTKQQQQPATAPTHATLQRACSPTAASTSTRPCPHYSSLCLLPVRHGTSPTLASSSCPALRSPLLAIASATVAATTIPPSQLPHHTPPSLASHSPARLCPRYQRCHTIGEYTPSSPNTVSTGCLRTPNRPCSRLHRKRHIRHPNVSSHRCLYSLTKVSPDALVQRVGERGGGSRRSSCKGTLCVCRQPNVHQTLADPILLPRPGLGHNLGHDTPHQIVEGVVCRCACRCECSSCLLLAGAETITAHVLGRIATLGQRSMKVIGHRSTGTNKRCVRAPLLRKQRVNSVRLGCKRRSNLRHLSLLHREPVTTATKDRLELRQRTTVRRRAIRRPGSNSTPSSEEDRSFSSNLGGVGRVCVSNVGKGCNGGTLRVGKRGQALQRVPRIGEALFELV